MAIYSKRKDWSRQSQSKTFTLQLPGMQMVVCGDPAVYREILGQQQDHFEFDRNVKGVFAHFFPNGMVSLESDEWRRRRKILQRGMSKQSLEPLIKVMCELTDQWANDPNLNSTDTIDVTSRITFDGFFRAMYGWNPDSMSGSEQAGAIFKACNTVTEIIGNLVVLPIRVLWHLPTKKNREANDAVRLLRAHSAEIIASRRAALAALQQDSHSSLLDCLIAATQDGADAALTDAELTDQVAGLFLAAFKTTSYSLQMILAHLAHAPAVQEKLRALIAARFPRGRADLERAALRDLDGIEYLTQASMP